MAKRSKPTGRPEPERLEVEVTKTVAWIGALKWFLGCITVVGVMWVLRPVMPAFAGHDTNLNVNIALTFTVAASLAAAGTGAMAYRQTQRANRNEARVHELEGRVLVLQDDLQKRSARLKDLERDLGGVRSDLRNLRGDR